MAAMSYRTVGATGARRDSAHRLVCDLLEPRERPYLAGHVRRPGDRDDVEWRPRRPQHPLAGLAQLIRRAREGQRLELVAAPGQHVGVVLDRGTEHARPIGEGSGEDVDRLGRVANQHDLVVRACPDERGHVATGRLERLRRQPRLESGATDGRCCTRG